MFDILSLLSGDSKPKESWIFAVRWLAKDALIRNMNMQFEFESHFLLFALSICNTG